MGGFVPQKTPLKGELSAKLTEGFFVLCPQLGQDLLIAGLAAGDPVKVAAGRFADRHALGGKSSADIAEIALMLKNTIPMFSVHISFPHPIKFTRGVLYSSNVLTCGLLIRSRFNNDSISLLR